MSIEKDWGDDNFMVFYPTCDGCGTQLDYEYEWEDAVDAMRNAGWRTKNECGEWINLCPRCQMKEDLRGLE